MSQDYFNQIEAYLEGQLSGEDRTAFEARVAEDPTLAEAVEQHRLALESLDVLVQQDLKQKLKEMEKERNQKSRFSIGRVFAIAASVLVLVLAVAYLGIRSSYSDTALVAEVFEPYKASGVRGDMPGGGLSVVEEGVAAYAKKNYPDAMSKLEGVSAGDPEYSKAQFYLGNIYMENGLYPKAARAFQFVVDKDDSPQVEAAQWYLALAQLNGGKKEEGKIILLGIINNAGHAYFEPAQRLLAKLNHPLKNLPGL